jgi:hypothetical protein
MASTYSPSLKLELIGNGDQSGTWGTTTNNNLGTLVEQAITGVKSIVMTNANYTLSDYNGVSDEARNAVLVVTGTNSAIRQIICPLANKLYVVTNNTSGGYAITIGGSSGTAVTIPNGVTAQVYCDGANTYSSQTGSAGNFTVNGTLVAAGLTDTGNLSVGGTLGVTGATSLTTGSISGIMTAPTAAPGTNTTQLATTAFVTAAVPSLGTMATQNANNVAITGGTITGLSAALPVASGGTGLTSAGANGNILTSNGTAWVSSAPASGGVTSAVAGNGVAVSGATGAVTFSAACPTFNTVGSYCSAGGVHSTSGFNFTAGSNYAAGSGNGQAQAATYVYVYTTNGFAYSNQLSGTWKWLGATYTTLSGYGDSNMAGLMCRVS